MLISSQPIAEPLHKKLEDAQQKPETFSQWTKFGHILESMRPTWFEKNQVAVTSCNKKGELLSFSLS